MELYHDMITLTIHCCCFNCRLVASKSGKRYLHDGQQHDADEFLGELLKVIENEDQNVSSLFTGREETKRKFLDTSDGACSVCSEFPRLEEENFFRFKLVPEEKNGWVDVKKLIDNQFDSKSDMIDIKCSNCCHHESKCNLSGVCAYRPGIQETKVKMHPNILLITFKRFEADGVRKLNTKLIVDDVLTLEGTQHYRLHSSIEHTGQSQKGGHYIAKVKKDEQWIVCDDAKTCITNGTSIHCNAYILVYVKETAVDKVCISLIICTYFNISCCSWEVCL